MISFKENGMKSIHPQALQPQLRWLILTGNRLTSLPEEIGKCHKLQKLMLSGNCIERLPNSIGACERLELIRLGTSCGRLEGRLDIPQLGRSSFVKTAKSAMAKPVSLMMLSTCCSSSWLKFSSTILSLWTDIIARKGGSMPRMDS